MLRGQEWFDGPIRAREASHSLVAGVTPTLYFDITHDAVLPYGQRPCGLGGGDEGVQAVEFVRPDTTILPSPSAPLPVLVGE